MQTIFLWYSATLSLDYPLNLKEESTRVILCQATLVDTVYELSRVDLKNSGGLHNLIIHHLKPPLPCLPAKGLKQKHI